MVTEKTRRVARARARRAADLGHNMFVHSGISRTIRANRLATNSQVLPLGEINVEKTKGQKENSEKIKKPISSIDLT